MSSENGPKEGTVFDGQFELGRLIGKGGMGSVYEAKDLLEGRRVAVKVLTTGRNDKEMRVRFQKEMQSAKSIEHSNVVPIWRSGLDHGYMYIAMRFIDGPDLAKLLSDGPLEPERAMRFFTQTAAAIIHMHSENFVHRDIKPANILIAKPNQQDEYAMLTDLGIARSLDDADNLTKGQPPGTPTFMAPEVFLHWVTSEKTDQYALACLLFAMLVGRPPFYGKADEVREMQLNDEPPPLEEAAPETPQALCDAVRRALSKDPDDRFDSVAQFLAACQSDQPSTTDSLDARLSPAAVSSGLFGLSPDRDERAPQLAIETFLTLWANDYKAPAGEPSSPKRRNGAIRSLAMQENFLLGMEDEIAPGITTQSIGNKLAQGEDLLGSDGISLAQNALQALIDSRTVQGSSGATLMLPFHESLLWYDARRSGTTTPWAVRKVNMRGTGVTLARMLLAPDSARDEQTRGNATVAVSGIKAALNAPSPLSLLAGRLSEIVPEGREGRALEPDERKAWEAGASAALTTLAERVTRHCANIVSQPHIPAPSKLLQIRNVLALDLVSHALNVSWEKVGLPNNQRFLVLTYTPEERRSNKIRVASEDSYQQARLQIARALRREIAETTQSLRKKLKTEEDWKRQFEKRSGLETVVQALATNSDLDFELVATEIFEGSRGGGYNRPVDAFRVLIESVDLLVGTGRYRYLRAAPSLVEAMVGAVGGCPMPVSEFLSRVHAEWSFVVGEAEMADTALINSLDGGLLVRNARFFESLLVDSGVATALSDQTCMVGFHESDRA